MTIICQAKGLWRKSSLSILIFDLVRESIWRKIGSVFFVNTVFVIFLALLNTNFGILCHMTRSNEYFRYWKLNNYAVLFPWKEQQSNIMRYLYRLYYDRNLRLLSRTRQIIRYRATATLWRPQIKQYTASNEGGGFTKLSGTFYKDLGRLYVLKCPA